MARVAGFEPANDGVRVHCLTAWRHPYSVLRSEHDTYFSFFYRICQENISNFFQKDFTQLKGSRLARYNTLPSPLTRQKSFKRRRLLPKEEKAVLRVLP